MDITWNEDEEKWEKAWNNELKDIDKRSIGDVARKVGRDLFPSIAGDEEEECLGTGTCRGRGKMKTVYEGVGLDAVANGHQTGLHIGKGKHAFEIIITGVTGTHNTTMEVGWMGHPGGPLNTYSLDGAHAKKRHLRTDHYGTEWTDGDVVATCIDFTSRTIEWYINGQHQGVAFTDIPLYLYTPYFSVTGKAVFYLNTGQIPFTYPLPEGYRPMQQGLLRLRPALSPPIIGIRQTIVSNTLSKQMKVVVVGVIWGRVSAMLNRHKALIPQGGCPCVPGQILAFVFVGWVPLLAYFHGNKDLSDKLPLLARIFEAAVGKEVSNLVWEATVQVLTFKISLSHHFDVQRYPTISPPDKAPPVAYDMDHEARHPHLHLRFAYLKRKPKTHPMGLYPDSSSDKDFTLCGVPRQTATTPDTPENYTRARIRFRICPELSIVNEVVKLESPASALLGSEGLQGCLLALCGDKDLSSNVLRLVLPRVWWHKAQSMSVLYEGVEAVDEAGHTVDTWRAIEDLLVPLYKAKREVLKNMLSHKILSPVPVILNTMQLAASDDPPARVFACSQFFFLCFPLVTSSAAAESDLLPPSRLVNGGDVLSASDRLGGSLHSLKEDHPGECAAHGGTSSTAPAASKGFCKLLSTCLDSVRKVLRWKSEMLLAKSRAVNRLSSLMTDAEVDLSSSDARGLVTHVAEITRQTAWAYSVMCGMDYERVVRAFLNIMLHYEKTNLFRFIPSVVLEVVLTVAQIRLCSPDGFNGLVRREPELVPFLLRRCHDQSATHPDLKEAIFSTLSSLLTNRADVCIQVFKRNRELSDYFIRSLLSAFATPHMWVMGLSVIIKMNVGPPYPVDITDQQLLPPCGSSRHTVERPNTSHLCRLWSQYASTTYEVLVKGPTSIHEFVTEVFNKLSWIMGEMNNCATELQASTVGLNDLNSRFLALLGNMHLMQLRKKTTVMRDLTMRLLTVLEVLTLSSPFLFAPSHENSLLSEQLATHITVLVATVLHLLRNQQVPRLLLPVVGCMVHLMYKVSDASGEDGFIPHVLEKSPFLEQLGRTADEWSPVVFQKLVDVRWEDVLDVSDITTLTKVNHLRHPSFMAGVHKAHGAWLVNKAMLEEQIAASKEDSICCICYTYPIDTILSCRHTCCRQCATRHFQTSSKCFFCNTEAAYEPIK
eukprot:TRINITY_DN36948_c0_g1_i1.p1 TRINITY_DN36948_c0_g1~~TRINITY_DN36948_c0_g1_i1.p1  ORF type:complete len:1172 (+),score=168.36 TRINITY_DN36948_c0_g1_i1:23-3517(+)